MGTITKRHAVCVLMIVLLTIPVTGICQQNFRFAACDWMMLKRQKLGEFQLAKDIHADGIEMDMGPLGSRPQFDNKLRDPHFQELFPRTADSLGIEVPSVAMSGFFAQSLLKRENYKELVQDCLNTMKHMKSQVAFLPLGGCGKEWMTDPVLRAELIHRLHTIGEMAKREGKVIGIRTGLDAKESKRMLKEIHSDGIKIYYNLQDAVDSHRDVCKELKVLGKDRICQIHASLTDSVTLDKDPRINMRQVVKTLKQIGWRGWLVVERSRDA
ncbi:MAG: TIM barrel protein, partial [Prevotella sp.]|nr:TIM barrel protein [Prevotella sp.]